MIDYMCVYCVCCVCVCVCVCVICVRCIKLHKASVYPALGVLRNVLVSV